MCSFEKCSQQSIHQDLKSKLSDCRKPKQKLMDLQAEANTNVLWFEPKLTKPMKR